MTTSKPDPLQYETIKQLVLSGQREQARQLLTRMVKEYPNDAHAWYGLAQVMDDPERVKFCLQRAQALMPASQVIRDQLARLNEPASGQDLSPAPTLADEQRAASLPAFTPIAGQSGGRVEAPPATSAASPAAVGVAHVGSLDDFASDAHISNRQERAKRRIKMRFLLGLPALLVVCCLLVLWAASQGLHNSGLIERLPAVHHVTYRVEGAASTAHISYYDGTASFIDQGVQTLPWSWEEDTFLQIGPAWVIAESVQPGKSITCIVLVDGSEVRRNTARGSTGNVGCKYEFPAAP